MARIRKKNTKPEVSVRRAIHALGIRFRLHRKHLPGCPDIVVPKRRLAIFVNGCFWHQHGCALTRQPKRNLAYWLPKLERNVQRDLRNRDALAAIGWRVAVLWECETKDNIALAQRLETLFATTTDDTLHADYSASLDQVRYESVRRSRALRTAQPYPKLDVSEHPVVREVGGSDENVIVVDN
jgi:DNA mismatch endonuclease (patch repair protein)